MRGILLALCLALAAPMARAACPDLPAMARYAQAIIERSTPAPLRDLTIDDARCAQDRLTAFLAQPWGDAAGHALRLGGEAPLRGTIFHGTLRAASPARLDARFGAVPAAEPALLLRIGADGLAEAGEDPVAILRHLHQVIPFLALPDLVFPPRGPTDATGWVAINLGVRLGVGGEPVAATPTAEFARALSATALVLSDDRRVLSRTTLAADPLRMLAWLARDLRREGRMLRAGQHVLLVGLAPAVAVEAGRTYTLVAEGLVGSMPVIATLE